MTTALDLDPELLSHVEEVSRRTGKSFSELTALALRSAYPFDLPPMPSRAPFVVKPFPGTSLPPEWTSGSIHDLLRIVGEPDDL